jgi:modulator of FtsH protease
MAIERLSSVNMSRTSAAAPSVLATNKVVRNTYLLLAMTLFTSAAAAGVAMATGAQPVHWLLMLAVFISGPFVISYLRDSVWALPLTFAFTAFMGYVLGPILSLYLSLPNGPQIAGRTSAT